MPRTRISKKKRNLWSAADVEALLTLAGKHYARVIARKLKRTDSATRQKALALGLSLRIR